MKIVVVTDDPLKAELLQQGMQETATIQWYSEIEKVNGTDADVCIDLLFAVTDERISQLKSMDTKLVIVNSVQKISNRLPSNFIRVNGWKSFLKRSVVEATSEDERLRTLAADVFNCFNKRIEWFADISGLVTARIVSTIINEAYSALEQQVSTKQEIDIAMKLGMNYPYGPFEWCSLIGIDKVYGLLNEMSNAESMYKPCDLLKKEAFR